MNTIDAPPPQAKNPLVGTVHLAGGAGPLYVVLAVSDGVAEIEFPESCEKATLPVASVEEDPIAE